MSKDNKSKFSVEGILQAAVEAKQKQNDSVGSVQNSLVTEKRILLGEDLSRELTDTFNDTGIKESYMVVEKKESKSLFGKTKIVDTEVEKERNYFYNTVFNLVLVELPFSMLKAEPIKSGTYTPTYTETHDTGRTNSSGGKIIQEITHEGHETEAWMGSVLFHVKGVNSPFYVHDAQALGKFFNEAHGEMTKIPKNIEFRNETAYVVYLESFSPKTDDRPSRKYPNLLLTAGIVNKLSLGSYPNSLGNASFTNGEIMFSKLPKDFLDTYLILYSHGISGIIFQDGQYSQIAEDYKAVTKQQLEEKESWDKDKWRNWGISYVWKAYEVITKIVVTIILLVGIQIFTIDAFSWFKVFSLFLVPGLFAWWFVSRVKKEVNYVKTESSYWSVFDFYRKYSYLEAIKRSSTPEGVARTPILKLFKDVEARIIK